MLTLTIADIKTGRIAADNPRWPAGVEHLARCRQCREHSPDRQPAAAATAPQ